MRSLLIVAVPVITPSAAVSMRIDSGSRRPRWAATANCPYSTKLSSSTRSAKFSRAVRKPLRDVSLAPISAPHLRYQRSPDLNALVHRFESVLLTQFAPAIELLDDKVHVLLRQVFPKLRLGVHCWVTMRVYRLLSEKHLCKFYVPSLLRPAPSHSC